MRYTSDGMPKVEDKYIWTSHALGKMKHYRMSESIVKRIIRHPDRIEEGIVEDFVAAMKETGNKTHPEAWVMYKPVIDIDDKGIEHSRLKILTAWKYPGTSKERDPVPEEVIKEIRGVIGF